jgi:DNA (cytosine-5)-methyltransferase 1
MRHVDLCSGIGGFALGFQWAGLSKPVLFCDIEAWSRQLLAKHWPDVPIAEDVKELASDPRRLVPDCDILSCGYPCQPFSQAGVRRGEEDDRHIWPEIFTIIEAKRPRWVVCENVAGHLTLGLNTVLSDLADKAGYEVQTFCLGAVALDAPHRRQRVWIIASHIDSDGEPDGTINAESGCWQLGASNVGYTDSGDLCRHDQTAQQGWRQQGFAAGCQDVADAKGDGRHERQSNSQRRSQGDVPREKQRFGDDDSLVADTDSQRGRCGDAERQDASDAGQSPQCQRHDSRTVGAGVIEPRVGGMADGLSTWLDEPRHIPRVATGVKQRAARLKGLGNAIVPQIAMQIGLTIKAVEHG